MRDLTDLVDRYIAMWNETDPARRRDLVAEVWTENGSYLDPMLEGEGRSGIEAMVEAVQARFPGHRFRRVGAVDAHHGRVRFAWELAPENGAPIVRGTDFAVLGEGQRLQAVTGFFDEVAQS